MTVSFEKKYVRFKNLNNIENFYMLKISAMTWYEVLEFDKDSHINILDNSQQLVTIFSHELIDAEFKDSEDSEDYQEYLDKDNYSNSYVNDNYVAVTNFNIDKFKSEVITESEKILIDSYKQSALNVIDEYLKKEYFNDITQIYKTIK